MKNWILFLGWLWAVLPLQASAPDLAILETVNFRGQAFSIHTVDLAREDLQLFWADDEGQLLRDFTGLDTFVAARGEHLLFAANAGMFEPDTKPVGLLVQKGMEKFPLNLREGTGNFYLKPNGVFLIKEKHEAFVMEASASAALSTPILWATQSGPLLVSGGTLHPEFIEGSKNLYIRSGVGVRKDGRVIFAISNAPVNLYTFAALFLHRLECPNALYLDGYISAFYFPGEKTPLAHSFGPMFGVVEKTKNP